MIVDFLQSRLVSDNIVVTKSFPKYCNAALSVVHESHTALFQCSYPLFPLGITKLMKIFYYRLILPEIAISYLSKNIKLPNKNSVTTQKVAAIIN